MTLKARGSNLGNGSDITNVTSRGVHASEIVSQTATQVVVVAGRSFAVGAGDVRVFSERRGETVGSNLFSYTGRGLKVLGPNSAWIVSGAAPRKAAGTMFGHLLAGNMTTQTL